MAADFVVLVVEDEFLVRLDLVEQLREMGFDVLEAANAASAIEILTGAAKIDAVFTDIDMPGDMDGLELAIMIRNRWPPIRVVITSGHREVELDRLPTESAFVRKPYSTNRVAELLRS